MENNEIPNPEIIEDVYKNKVPSKSISNLKDMILNDHLRIEDDNAASNHALSPSVYYTKEGKRRRQGLYIIEKNKEKEQKENSSQELKNSNITEEKKEENCFVKIINEIIKYESSETGCIIMLVVIVISLCFYDFKILFFPRKYRKIYLGIYSVFMLYYFFDFIFRMFIIDDLYKTLYFWIDFISWISMFGDIDDLSYSIIEKIVYNKSNNKYLSYKRQTKIEVVKNIVQILQLLRVVKFYKLFVIILEENEKKKHISKMIAKLNEKRNKFPRAKTVVKYIKTSITNVKDGNANNNNNNNTTVMPFQTPVPQTVDNYYKSAPKKFTVRASIFALNSTNEENKKWEKEMIKQIKAHMAKPNKISQKITEGISRLMMIIVILVFIVSIYTDEDNFNTESFSYMLMCKLINKYIKKNNLNHELYVENYVDLYLLTNILPNYPIIQVQWNDKVVYKNNSMDQIFDNYHKRDISYIFPQNDSSTVIIVSKRGISKMISITYLIRLFYIVIVISALCLLINNDVYNLIFHPLEKIGKVVDTVSKDPVGSKTVTELKNNYQQDGNKNEDKSSVSYEIKIIQSAIIRISALMAINFGEAGGEILKENISSSEGLNPMLKGKKIQAIFGFCFIHNFSEINEAFQERTMIFVNQISDIVHSCVDKFNGITNKNLGDCYLLAWKFKEKEKDKDKEKEQNENKMENLIGSNLSNDKSSELADCALLGFLNIIKKINKSQNILAYRKNPDLIKKFGPKYTVQMGFGLHTGWGIEGAIGSFYKIDCSYLSPNVNIAARLETATNIYGVDILFSGEFYDLLSDFMKRKCRKIDIVTLKGSEKPVSLYTVDINRNIHPGKIISKKDRMTLTERRSYYALKKKKLWHKYLEQKSKLSLGESYLKQSKGLRQLLKPTKSDMFYTCFEDGFNDYIDGEWKEAAQFLEKARYLDKSDGPTKTILSYIKSLNLKPPDNWDGYRVLTSKT